MKKRKGINVPQPSTIHFRKATPLATWRMDWRETGVKDVFLQMRDELG